MTDAHADAFYAALRSIPGISKDIQHDVLCKVIEHAASLRLRGDEILVLTRWAQVYAKSLLRAERLHQHMCVSVSPNHRVLHHILPPAELPTTTSRDRMAAMRARRRNAA